MTGKNPTDQKPQHQQSDTELKLMKDLAQMTESCKRALADLDNYKKTLAEQKKRIFDEAERSFLRELLPILDSFERAKAFFEKLPEEHRTGIEAIYVQLKQIFDKHGVKEIETTDKKFDPRLHEAMMKGPGEAEKVLAEFEKGYTIGDSIIRPAKVKIGDGSEAAT